MAVDIFKPNNNPILVKRPAIIFESFMVFIVAFFAVSETEEGDLFLFCFSIPTSVGNFLCPLHHPSTRQFTLKERYVQPKLSIILC
jgi:hypothetical protein